MGFEVRKHKLLDTLKVDKVQSFTNTKKSQWIYTQWNPDCFRVPHYWYMANATSLQVSPATARAYKEEMDTRTRLGPGNYDAVLLRDYQVDPYKEMLATVRDQGSLIINVRCGWGKTAVGCRLGLELGGRFLVLDDSILIGTGWIELITKVTGIPPTVIKSKVDYSTDTSSRIFLASVATLTNVPDSHLPRGLTTVFVDEVRCFLTMKRIEQMLRLQCRYMIGASADLDRMDGMHEALPLFFGPSSRHVKRIWSDPFDYVRILTDLKPTVEMRMSGFGKAARMAMDWSVVVKSIAEDRDFTNYAVRFIRTRVHKKVLVVSKSKKQVREVHAQLLDLGVDVERLWGNMKTHRDAAVVVAVMKKVVKGYDPKGCSRGWDGRHFEEIIMLSDTLDPEQIFGRGFRVARPKIISFIHDLPKLHQHDKIVREWCKERNYVEHTIHARFK